MLYLVKAFDHSSQNQVKKLEVIGFDAVQALEEKWSAQGYDVTSVMQCTKYIELMKAKGATPSRERQAHTPETKAEAIRLVMEEGKTREQAAEALSVGLKTVRNWIAEYASKRGAVA